MVNLKIILENINSIIKHSKREIFKNFLQNNNPDIVLITETKLNSRHKIHFQNYSCIRADRIIQPNPSSCGGGTLILIKNGLLFTEINCTNYTSFECCTIKIHLQNSKFLFISSIYHTPYHGHSIDTNELNSLLQLFNNNPFVIGGDFNARHSYWNNNINCVNGKKCLNGI